MTEAAAQGIPTAERARLSLLERVDRYAPVAFHQKRELYGGCVFSNFRDGFPIKGWGRGSKWKQYRRAIAFPGIAMTRSWGAHI